MKAFDELDEPAKDALILMAVSPIMTKFLSWKDEEIADIPLNILNDMTLLSTNRHPKSDDTELSLDVRTRIKNRVVKSLYKFAYEQMKLSNYPDYNKPEAFNFDVSAWLTAMARAEPIKFLSPKQQDSLRKE